MNSFQNSPSLSNHITSIIVRLRGPDGIINKENEKENKKKSKSPLQKKTFQRINSRVKKANKTPEKNERNNQNNLDPNSKYTIFTSKNPSNLLIISNKQISGNSINDNFITKNDLYDFSQSILKETSLLEFDKVYNETISLDRIYNENLKDNITNLIHGKNSCVFFFGPIDSGKSYLLRGSSDNNNEQGLLSRCINDIFSLVDLNKQANFNLKHNLNGLNKFIVKISSYQVYMDNVNDLLDHETKKIKLEKYYNNGIINCDLINLTQKEIRNKYEYDICIKETIHNRKTLLQKLRVNDLKRKSHFIISISLEKREKDTNNYNNENLIENYSQIDFVELCSSNYGLMNINENDVSQNALLYRNTSKTFNSICDNIVSLCDNNTPKTESKLTLCLKKTLQYNSNIVFINCINPFEFPLNYSFKSLKFGNWLRNQILNRKENNVLKNRYDNDEEQNVFNQLYNNNMNDNMNDNMNNNMNNIMNNNINNKYNNDDIKNIMTSPNENNSFLPRKDVINNSVNLSNQNKNESFNTMPNFSNRGNFSPLNIPNKQINNFRSNDSNVINYSLKEIPNIKNKNMFYSNNDENEIKRLDNNIRNQISNSPYKKINSELNNSNNNIIDNNNNILDNNNNLNYLESPNDRKLRTIKNSIKQMEEKSMEIMNKKDELMNLENKNNKNYNLSQSNLLINSTEPSNKDLNTFKQEYASLKSDNILFKDDINRLSKDNKVLLDQLNEERKRTMDLSCCNERLLNEKCNLENEVNIIKEELSKYKKCGNGFEEVFKEKLISDSKIKDLEKELNNIKNEKSKYEIEYKVLLSRYEDVCKKFENLNFDYCQNKQCHNQEICKIEDKVNCLLKEVENLQNENFDLKKTCDCQKNEINFYQQQNNMLNDKYNEIKKENEFLNQKLRDSEINYKTLIKEKELEEIMKRKEEENKRNKMESKVKLVNDLQNKIQNYRSQRLMKKNNEEF